MRIRKIYVKILSFIILFVLFGLSGCNERSETEMNNSELFISYYDEDNQLLQRKKYTMENFSLLVLDEREGYVFVGWFLDESLENIFDESKLTDYFNEGKISLYASWELAKNNYQIEVKGLVQDRMVINPAFTWENPYNDSEFIVKIFKGADVIDSANIEDNYYVSSLLEYNCSYKFVLQGKDSHNIEEVSFTTVIDNDYEIEKDIILNDPFMDNMVIQRDEVINISGVGPQNLLIAVKFGLEMYFGISDVDGNFNVEVLVKDEDVWLNTKALSELSMYLST